MRILRKAALSSVMIPSIISALTLIPVDHLSRPRLKPHFQKHTTWKLSPEKFQESFSRIQKSETEGVFMIEVIRAQDLPNMDLMGLQDPYVIMEIMNCNEYSFRNRSMAVLWQKARMRHLTAKVQSSVIDEGGEHPSWQECPETKGEYTLCMNSIGTLSTCLFFMFILHEQHLHSMYDF